MATAHSIQYTDPESLERMQFDLLSSQLRYVYENSRFYRRKFEEADVEPEDIKNFTDFEQIPLTTKEELRESNWDLVCRPPRDIVDIGTTTGTSGEPVVLPVTGRDWEQLVNVLTVAFDCVGITREDVVQLTLAFDQLFSVSAPVDDALKLLGATSVRTGPGNDVRQIELMRLLGTTVLYATPDYMIRLADQARELGHDPARDFALQKAVLVGQPLYGAGWMPTQVKTLIETTWGIQCYSDYGSMEMFIGFHECLAHGGHHTFPEYHYLEIVDGTSGAVLEPGQEGELVVTHLQMEGVPLVRFRQGDLTSLNLDRCPCGRTSPRIMALIARADEMLKIKGTSVYPQQIEDILAGVRQIAEYFVEVVADENGQDDLRIHVSPRDGDGVALPEMEAFLRSKLRFTPRIVISEEEAILREVFRRGTRKPKRFWDRRESQVRR